MDSFLHIPKRGFLLAWVSVLCLFALANLPLGAGVLLLVVLVGYLLLPGARWASFLALFTLLFFALVQHPSQIVMVGVLGAGALYSLDALIQEYPSTRRYVALLGGVGVLGVLLVTRINGVVWLGFSYLALRVLALLIDFWYERLPPLRFDELLIYVLFPPAFLAGPIDRAERFVTDLRQPLPPDVWYAGKRLAMGVFKKFVLADLLALVALSPALAPDIKSAGGAWLAVYLYALRLYWDFSGYSDMAIGLGLLVGIKLPENFDNPYLKTNLAQFWRSWHMSLTDWFRAYVFLPISRWLLRRKLPISEYLIAQVLTMTLIAAWHGLTPNFLLWGLWHAGGLYIQRLFGGRVALPAFLGAALTFHFVAVGWVFFALPTPTMSLEILRKMVGL